MNNAYLDYVKQRLYDWCEWYSQENFFGIGYSSTSLEYALMREGVINQKNYPKILPENTEAEEIECLVNEMSQQNLNMATALRYYYFSHGSLRAKARKLAISHSVFKAYVDMAHQWMVGRLSVLSRMRNIKRLPNDDFSGGIND